MPQPTEYSPQLDSRGAYSFGSNFETSIGASEDIHAKLAAFMDESEQTSDKPSLIDQLYEEHQRESEGEELLPAGEPVDLLEAHNPPAPEADVPGLLVPPAETTVAAGAHAEIAPIAHEDEVNGPIENPEPVRLYSDYDDLTEAIEPIANEDEIIATIPVPERTESDAMATARERIRAAKADQLHVEQATEPERERKEGSAHLMFQASRVIRLNEEMVKNGTTPELQSAYDEANGELIDMFKRCEAAGVETASLEFIAQFLDSHLASVGETKGRHVAIIEEATPQVRERGRHRAETEPLSIEKVKKTVKGVVEAFTSKFMRKRWEAPSFEPEEAVAQTVTPTARRREMIEREKAGTPTPETTQAHKETRRRRLFLGIAAGAALPATGLAVLAGVANIQDATQNADLHPDKAPEASAPAPLTTEAAGIDLGGGVRVGPITSSSETDTASSSPLDLGPATSGNRADSISLEGVSSVRIDVGDGEGGFSLIDDINKKLGTHLDHSDWTDLGARFERAEAGSVYGSGINRGLNHEGKLSDTLKKVAVQYAQEKGKM